MTRPSIPSQAARGSSLVLAMILLGVLAVIGVAAVQLGSQERVNAAGKARRDLMLACAHAARAQLWVDLTRSGSTYLRAETVPTALVLPDGTELQAPSAPTYSDKKGLPVADLIGLVTLNLPTEAAIRDITNTMTKGRGPSSPGYRILARCRDAKGRELSVELNLRFAL